MAADLLKQRVAVLFASPIPAALAAKAATTSIPIVFAIGSDPVETELGLRALNSRARRRVAGGLRSRPVGIGRSV